jgi:hypothetical protein
VAMTGSNVPVVVPVPDFLGKLIRDASEIAQ